MGLLVNASYVGINFQDATREQSLVIGTTNPVSAPGTAGGARFPDAQGRFTGYGDRFRPSANAAFQWKPTPELEIYADGLFQGYRGKDTNRWIFVPVFGDIRLTNVTTSKGAGGATLIDSATVSNAVAPDGYYGSANGKTDTYQAGGGAIWKRGGLQISGDVAYTDSTYTFDLVNVDYAFASSPVRNISYNAGSDGGAAFDFVNFDVTDPNNFIARGLYQEYVKVSGKDIQTRADVQYDFGGGLLKRIQIGFRYNDRDAARDRASLYNNFINGRDIPDLRIPISALPGGQTESSLPAFKYNNAFAVHSFAAIPSSAIRDNLAAYRAFFQVPAGRPAFNPTENFTANEKAYAGYAQLKYGFDIGSIVVDGVAGLRAVKPRTTTNGFLYLVATNTYQPVTGNKDYTDYLPNVSTRVAFSDELQLRLAYTQTRTRPNFLALSPTLTIDPPISGTPGAIPIPGGGTTTTYRTASGGNPDLRPLTSNNYDASLEWYFSRSGSLTGAIFQRDTDGFIFNTLTTRADPNYTYLRVNQPVNSGKTKFKGAEVSFTSFLDIDGLPDWAKGFGVQANGTYIDSKGDLSADFNALLDNQRVPFNGVSKWTYNIVALYERPFFSARMAYNYRSKFVSYYSVEALDNVNGRDRVRGVYEQGRGQLDASMTVTPVPNITVAFDIVNLLGNPLQRKRQFDDAGDSFARQVIYLERTYSLGVRFRF